MSTNQHVQTLYNKQAEDILQEHIACLQNWGDAIYNNTPYKYNNQWMCPPFFDTIQCWPPQLPNTLRVVSCPPYIIGFSPDQNATKFCTENATWYAWPNSLSNETFTNYSTCPINVNGGQVTVNFLPNSTANITAGWLSQDTMKALKVISETGYAVSLISLLIAFTIMFSIRRLHCARNILHMNLFASFMLRSFIHIVKDMLFVSGIGLTKDVAEVNGKYFFVTDSTNNNFECKLIVTFVEFFTTANYSWILMEGLYLNNLILRALFTDSNKNLMYYIGLGWGLPILVIIPWIIARIKFEDNFCWTTNDNPYVYAILIAPTMVSVLLNLILFIIISVVLYTKLKSPGSEDWRRYLKWAKSTLVLVPLFGVNYAVFFILYLSDREFEWLICDTLFGSFQGFFVAVLYCFLNGEVKSELKPYLKRLLTCLATNNVTRVCFPCGDRFDLGSAVGRQSVCTTLSCSSHSLYTNHGVSRRSSKTKCDILSKVKIPNIVIEKQKDTFIPNGVKKCPHYISTSKYPDHVTNNLETCLCFENRSQNHLQKCEEETAMLDKNPITA